MRSHWHFLVEPKCSYLNLGNNINFSNMISISCKKLGSDTKIAHQSLCNIWFGAIIFFMIFCLVAVWVNFSCAEVSYDDNNRSIKTFSLEECLQIATENSKI